jgi:crossover junction endodeoxyribonuclease RuvC
VGITPQQFEQMKQRIVAPRRRAAPILEPAVSGPSAKARILLGIDPSLRGTGYGVIEWRKPQPRVLTYGVVQVPATAPISTCLLQIAQTIRDVIRQHHPTVCVVEGLFFAQNLKTALVMGQARGASLVAAAEAGLEIYEIAPRKVKQAIVGYGAAQKEAVAKMVQRMLHLAELPPPDAADALALALAHAQETSRYSLSSPKRV